MSEQIFECIKFVNKIPEFKNKVEELKTHHVISQKLIKIDDFEEYIPEISVDFYSEFIKLSDDIIEYLTNKFPRQIKNPVLFGRHPACSTENHHRRLPPISIPEYTDIRTYLKDTLNLTCKCKYKYPEGIKNPENIKRICDIGYIDKLLFDVYVICIRNMYKFCELCDIKYGYFDGCGDYDIYLKNKAELHLTAKHKNKIDKKNKVNNQLNIQYKELHLYQKTIYEIDAKIYNIIDKLNLEYEQLFEKKEKYSYDKHIHDDNTFISYIEACMKKSEIISVKNASNEIQDVCEIHIFNGEYYDYDSGESIRNKNTKIFKLIENKNLLKLDLIKLYRTASLSKDYTETSKNSDYSDIWKKITEIKTCIDKIDKKINIMRLEKELSDLNFERESENEYLTEIESSIIRLKQNYEKDTGIKLVIKDCYDIKKEYLKDQNEDDEIVVLTEHYDDHEPPLSYSLRPDEAKNNFLARAIAKEIQLVQKNNNSLLAKTIADEIRHVQDKNIPKVTKIKK